MSHSVGHSTRREVAVLYDSLVVRYDSLDALLRAVATGRAPVLPHGGFVRVHPAAVREAVAADALTPRERLARFRLQLVVTPAIDASTVELRLFTEQLSDEMEDGGPAPRLSPPRGQRALPARGADVQRRVPHSSLYGLNNS